AVRHVNGELGQVPPFGFGKLLCAPDTALDWVLPSFRKETPHLRELLGRAGAEGLEILSVAIPTVRQMWMGTFNTHQFLLPPLITSFTSRNQHYCSNVHLRARWYRRTENQ